MMRLRVDRSLFALLGVVGSLAGCVAPEAPPPPRPAAAAPSMQPNTANYEDAPRPNRSVRGPSSSVIQMGK